MDGDFQGRARRCYRIAPVLTTARIVAQALYRVQSPGPGGCDPE